MAPSVVAVGRRWLVWMVAFTAGIGLVGQAVVSAIWGPPGESVVWIAAAALVTFSAVQAEKIKWFLEE